MNKTCNKKSTENASDGLEKQTVKRSPGPLIAALRVLGSENIMNLIYKEALPEDTQKCIDLRGKTRENALSAVQLADIGITHESWRQGVVDNIFIGCVCLSDEQIVGFCYGHHQTGEILVLGIHPDYENKGIGKVLLGKVMSKLKDAGFTTLFLGCSSDPRSRSYGFYRHLGWVSTGEFDSRQDEILEYVF